MAHYKELIVYQKSKSLSKDILVYFSKNKGDKLISFVILQLLRSSCSVGANIAEGYGRYYKKDYRHFLSIARGSCFETDYWLDILIELNLFNNDILKDFSEKNQELGKMLTTMMKNLDS